MPTLAPPEHDLALLERFARDGDAEAFAEIVRRYAGVVYAASYRVLHDRGRAEDVSQEVFFRLLRRPQSVSQSLGGWLHQCATRLSVDELRSESARRRREAAPRTAEAERGPAATAWQDISAHVDEALAELPPESRELLVSHFLRGKSQSVIAIETRTSPATISRRMRDAVTALRAELRRRGVTVAPAVLICLCRANAPLEAAPAALVAELGKMALVGTPAAAAPFAWHSVSAWCDAAARTWGWPAELVKQAVGAAATSAVALVVGVLVAQGFLAMHRLSAPAPGPAVAEEVRAVRADPHRPTPRPATAES
jgi:RNA polymerase sigma-70 factor (ECF subfamily)